MSRARNYVAILLISLVVMLYLAVPAYATRIPFELGLTIKQQFPNAKVRLDGSIETFKGDLFLPLMPAQAKKEKRGNVRVDVYFPSMEDPKVIVFSNGWCYLHVIQRGIAKTVVLTSELPDKLRKTLLNCKFPSDLIVPENFVLPQSLKPLLVDVALRVEPDASIAKDDFGKPTKVVKRVAKDTSGMYFFTSLNSGNITMVDGKDFTKVADFPTEGTPCNMAIVGGQILITDVAKSRILVLDPVKREFLGQLDLPPKSAPKGIAALPNGRLIYVSESSANDIAVIETSSRRVLMRTKVSPGPSRMVMTPNGNFLVVLSVPSGQASIVSTMNQRVMATMQVGNVPTEVVITPDSQYAYVSNRMSNTVSIIDLAKRAVVGTIETGIGPTGIALNLEADKLYVTNARENTISEFDTKTHQKLRNIKLPVEIDFPGTILLMPDGKHLLVSSEASDSIGIFDLEKFEFVQQSSIGHTSHDIIWIPV